MSEESKTPEDDNLPRLHAWTTPKHDRFTLVSDTPVTRSEALRILRQSPPRDLGNATEVELADYESDTSAARALGPVRVTHSIGDMLRSMMGVTVNVPLSRFNR